MTPEFRCADNWRENWQQHHYVPPMGTAITLEGTEMELLRALANLDGKTIEAAFAAVCQAILPAATVIITDRVRVVEPKPEARINREATAEWNRIGRKLYTGTDGRSTSVINGVCDSGGNKPDGEEVADGTH